MRTLRIVCIACAAIGAIGITAPRAALAQGDALRIGSKRFTESYILAQVLAQTAAPHTAVPPQVEPGLGNTAIVYQALRSGAIDLYPEYTGTISLEILKSTKALSMAELNQALAPLGLGVAIPLGFNDGYALAMRGDEAKRLGIRSLSDLAQHPALKFGLSNEFIGRADGWQGLAQRYGFTQKPTGLDHGLAYEALARKQVDVIDIYTTDAKIDQLGLRVLTDDRHYFPLYDAVVLYRLDVPKRFPKAWAALQTLAGSIDEKQMIAMNARAELHGVAFDAIARDFLASRARGAAAGMAVGTAAGATASGAPPPAESRGFWAKLFGPDLWRLTWQHLALVAVSVAVAVLIGVPLAVFAFFRPRLRTLVLGAAGLLQTVPSLALLAVLISLLKMIGAVPALIALMLYALLPIMRNTDAGLASVSPGLRLAGLALGMTKTQRLRLIELPLALPTLVAGVRIATSITIGTATIAAFIGAGGYGERIVTGLALNDNQLLLAGAIPAIVLALLSEVLFEFIERAMRRRRT
ncbi:MAG: ABC transporter, substrate-binding protein [Burkholderiaceae bacterium]|nr:MAG: ABC transporter, substrate-binding protein [Burkholderiaceae bacterium]